jgi:serine/threonine protein kinase/Tol biopolymer transport system component
MGEVYRARDGRLDRIVAVKVLPPELSSSQALERFEREAKAIAALNHPNICTIHDVGSAGQSHFLVMELLDGESLHQRLTRGPLDLASIVETGLALADALAAAHARGLIHRDLKPANIVLTARGPKILDFGLAKAVNQTGTEPSPAGVGHALHSQELTLSAHSPLTDPGVTVGTIAYMSPEQLRGEALDARTDLFSLGLVLYEMATGRRAFAGATNAVTSAAILHDAPTPPRQLRPDLPPRLEQAILTALEKDRELRTQTASELRAELTRITREIGSSRQTSVPSTASSTAPPASAAASATASPASSSDAQLVAGLVGRHRGAVVAVATLVAAAILGGVYAVMRGGAARDASSARPSALTIGNLQVDQLTSSGTASSPAISPDGKYVVYIEQGNGGDSLRVRQVTTGSNVEVVPAEPGVRFRGATVTPDGGFVDYLKVAPSQRLELWRIPFLGGTPQRRLDNIASLVGWSPDGRQMAYLRIVGTSQSELVVTASDGSGERVVTTRTAPERFLTMNFPIGAFVPAWSPDGRTLAVLGSDVARQPTGQVVFVDVATGSTRAINAGPPLIGSALGWLDSTNVLVSMIDKSSAPLQLWQMSFPQGTLTHLTNDLNQYAGVSFTSDRNALVTGRSEFSAGISTSDTAATEWKEVVPTGPIKGPVGFGLAWSGEDLIYVGGVGSDFALLRRRQSTGATETLAPLGGNPSVSRDGSTIVFFDYDRLGPFKMDAEGRGRLPLTRGGAGSIVTPDGREIVANTPRAITVSAIDGTGAPREVVKAPIRTGGPAGLAISPDGRWIAYATFDDQSRPATVICDLATCKSRRTLPPLALPHWTADGKSITYVDAQTATNIWVQPVDVGAPRQLTHFPNDGRTIWDFAWSADGKRLAVGRARATNNIVLFKGLSSHQ